jgi:carbamoyl-phosphate synthase large subunit
MDIDRAEDRYKFSELLDSIGVDQPSWREAPSLDDAVAFAQETGYPVLLRPSYVLSGAAMGVATNARECDLFLKKAADVSPKHPVVVSKFFEDAKEIEVDAVASRGQILAMAVVEHVENAGVHSGDATLVVPPQRTYPEVIRKVEKITERIADALRITGPLNVQYLAQGTNVKVIEANLRASRSFPFVSKICKVNFIELAMKAILDVPVARVARPWQDLDYVGVKAPHFSFTRLQGADPTLGVEMASTGEVGCLGDDFEEAFLKALISVGFKFPIRTVLLSTGTLKDKVAFIEGAKLFESLGIGFFATQGTAEFLSRYSIKSVVVHWPLENRSPNAGELIEQRKIDLVINIPKNFQEIELTNDYYIRRKAVDFGIPLLTNIQLANRLAESLSRKQAVDLGIKELQAY